MVNWPIKPINDYILAHEGFRSKTTSVCEIKLNSTCNTPIKLFCLYFPNYLIGQLSQLTLIRQSIEALEVKQPQHIKVNLNTDLKRASKCSSIFPN